MTRSRLVRLIADVRPGERLFAAQMFGYFFLVITSFWILKPVKKALFIQHYDASGFAWLGWQLNASQAELLAKTLNMFVAMVAVVAFSALARRFRRQRLSLIVTGFFLAAFVAYMPVLDGAGGAVLWSFYLFGDLFSTLMVAAFFAFLNDSVTASAARRLYGIVGLGGVLGGVFGTTVVSAFIHALSPSQWLAVTFLLGIGIGSFAAGAGRRAPAPVASADDGSGSWSGPARNPAVAGAQLVLRSSYLASIVAVVGLYEVVSTVVDFQFTSTVAHYLDGPAIGRQFARVYAVTNIASLLVQLLLTSLVMRRLGVGAALCVLPFAILSSSAAFCAFPVLWLGSALSVSDNALHYSINQSAKEALYVPTTLEEKYQAKAFIDMFVQRFAKTLAVGVSLGLTMAFRDFEAIRWLTAFTLPLMGLWLAAVRHAGRRFRAMTGDGDAADVGERTGRADG